MKCSFSDGFYLDEEWAEKLVLMHQFVSIKCIKIMFELFVMGGTLFMGMVSIVLFSGVAVAVRTLIAILKGADEDKVRILLSYVKSIGLLALVVGVLGQLIGLYGAFEAIEEAGEVSQGILAAGIKISSITTLYGLVSFVLCYIFYFGLSLMLIKK